MGFDRLSPKVFRYCAPALYLPIYHLFSQCFQQSSLPHEWKIHCITPIFKSGDRTMVSNYRPISLLSIISKVLERIVYNNIIHFLEGSFSDSQFGFLPGRSSLCGVYFPERNGNGTEVAVVAYLDCIHDRVSIIFIVFIGNTLYYPASQHISLVAT